MRFEERHGLGQTGAILTLVILFGSLISLVVGLFFYNNQQAQANIASTRTFSGIVAKTSPIYWGLNGCAICIGFTNSSTSPEFLLFGPPSQNEVSGLYVWLNGTSYSDRLACLYDIFNLGGTTPSDLPYLLKIGAHVTMSDDSRHECVVQSSSV